MDEITVKAKIKKGNLSVKSGPVEIGQEVLGLIC